MAPKWLFRELRPGDKDRQPTQSEFFATDAIRNLAEALVRESIQNSLDAKRKDIQAPVKVSFRLAVGENAMTPDCATKYFGSGWNHFSANGNGLDNVLPLLEQCSYLVIEDFGTSGLTGDINQWRHLLGIKNPFYYFFRTEGRSGKGEQDRGRWGIGKYVFPRSSKVHAFIAYTVRSDDSKQFLMGQSILNSHAVGDKYFTPDGDFGVQNELSGLVEPTDDQNYINEFLNDFHLARTSESGLSVVVPWVDSEITKNALVEAVIEGYFYPILTGDLVVSISDADGCTDLARETIENVYREGMTLQNNALFPIIKLALWARDIDRSSYFQLNPANAERPIWESSMIPETVLSELRSKYRQGERLAIIVPLTVREKSKPPRQSYFKMLISSDGGNSSNTSFIRDGIIISDVRGKWVSGVQALIIIDDPPLATLLGDSENPAHTQWQKDGDHFRGKYFFGKSYIDFVSGSAAMFIKLLNESDEQLDKNLLRDVFALPIEEDHDEPRGQLRKRRRNIGESLKPDPMPEPRKKRYILSKVASGFVVSHGQSSVYTGKLAIAVAYDRRRGSPIKKYVPADFRLNMSPLKVSTMGCKVVDCQFNQLTVDVCDPIFSVSVLGFDENRDLYVDVDAMEVSDD